jgi:hypothetical protein
MRYLLPVAPSWPRGSPYDAKRKRYRYPRWNFDGWDLRVVETLDGKEVDVCEVFYDTKGVPRAWTSAIEVVADNVAGIGSTQRQIARALRRPTLVRMMKRGEDVLVPKPVTRVITSAATNARAIADAWSDQIDKGRKTPSAATNARAIADAWSDQIDKRRHRPRARK